MTTKTKNLKFDVHDARTRKEWDDVNCKRCLNLKADPLAQPRAEVA